MTAADLSAVPQPPPSFSIAIPMERGHEEQQQQPQQFSSSSDDDECAPFFTPRASLNRLIASSSRSQSSLLLHSSSACKLELERTSRGLHSSVSVARSVNALPIPSNTQLLPPPYSMKSLSRNSSTSSMGSVPLRFHQLHKRNNGGSIPNGMAQQQQHLAQSAAIRSFAACHINGFSGGGEAANDADQQQQSLPLLAQNQQQNNSRSPFFAAALNNSANEYWHQCHAGQKGEQIRPPPSQHLHSVDPANCASTRPNGGREWGQNNNNSASALPQMQNGTNPTAFTVGESARESLGSGSVAGDSVTLVGSGSVPPMVVKARLKSRGGFSHQQLDPLHKHRGELSIHEKYRYDLSRAQLKASSRTSALLAGFAMIALVELQYQESTPKPLLIMLGVVTSLLVSVHLLALMMSTCLLPYIEANGCTQDSPHIKLRFYIELSWLFSTCIGLLLFLLEIGVIFFVKFNSIGYTFAAYITTGMLVPVVVVFIIISYLIHRNRFTHSIERVNDKVTDLQKYLYESELNASAPQKNSSVHRNLAAVAAAGGLQGVTVVRNVRD